MPSGLKIKDIVPGTGPVAERGKIVVIHYMAFLNHGEECGNSYVANAPVVVDLARRESVAGLRMGVEGMRVGGKRELIVSPHLAYGEAGISGLIPPNALIRFEVELLKVCERTDNFPEKYPSQRSF